MRVLLTAFLAGLVLWPTQQALAADSSSGCGPGWYILKDNSLVSSALRMVTNGVLFPAVTLGMTLGTSNCTQHKIVLTEKESLHYATMNFHELRAAAARGEGVYLEAFADVIGCETSGRAALGRRLQSDFGRVFPGGATPESALTETYRAILADPTLSRSCSLRQG